MVIKITPRDTLKNLLHCNNYNNCCHFLQNFSGSRFCNELRTAEFMEFVPSKIVVRENCGLLFFVLFFFVPIASGNTARNSFIGKVKGKIFLVCVPV